MKVKQLEVMCSVFTDNVRRYCVVMGFWEPMIMRGQPEEEDSENVE